MGVSGSGKTTIGKQLSSHLHLDYYDADDFHPPANIEKMRKGIPLDDADRTPWLQSLASKIAEWQKDGAILGCSALKESYRSTLTINHKVEWVYLSGNYELIYKRMQTRDHFMNPEMLQSQFDALEVPAYGMHVSICNTPSVVVSEIMSKINLGE